MATYQELMAQAQQMLAEAEKLRQDEVVAAINEIRTIAAKHGITLEQLRQALPAGTKPKGKAKANTPPRYKGPNGELWAGGRGRKPEWVRQIMAQGQKLSDYELPASKP